MHKLSIITCCYNVSQYLRESLDSVFNQTFKDFELILVDDGSTDETKNILIEYTNHANVKLLENQYNEGIAISRNRALLNATGEYVAIHDGDDISLPYRFEREISFLEEHPSITFMGGLAIKINHTGAVIGSMVYPPPTTEDAFYVIKKWKLNPIIDPTSIYRRADILNDGGYIMDPFYKTSSDFHLWCRLLSRGHLLANIQEPLIKYRINPQGVTRTQQNEMLKATDYIWASFRRRHFPKVTLRPDYFHADSFTEYGERV